MSKGTRPVCSSSAGAGSIKRYIGYINKEGKYWWDRQDTGPFFAEYIFTLSWPWRPTFDGVFRHEKQLLRAINPS